MSAQPDFRSLVEQHQRMVYSLALRVTGEPGTAEEVAQDAFLALFRSQQPFHAEEHIRFWLRRVTIHRATDALRRRRRQPETLADEWQEDDHAALSQGAAHDEAVNAAVLARLEELLRGLPESMRVAVVLRYQEEMSPPEIAALLEQPLATVKSNLQRGLQLLRKKAAITLKEYIR